MNGQRLTVDELVDRIQDEEVGAYLAQECFAAMLEMYRKERARADRLEEQLFDARAHILHGRFERGPNGSDD